MHFFRNWPEGLFIVLVMIAPLIAALVCRDTINFFVMLVAGMAVGLLAWLAVLFLCSCAYDRGRRNDAVSEP